MNMMVTGRVSKCKYCGADILWVKSKKTQKWYAINAEWHNPADPVDVLAGNKTHYHRCSQPVSL
jgi:hypothetical protein